MTNAIILAAGVGSRLQPLTFTVPKPLIKIAGLPIIERQIIYLKAAGIDEIHLVVGYAATQFDYLKSKYNVQLIFNPEFNNFNNLYSLYVSKHVFGDTWVIEGDVYLKHNFFRPDLDSSTYFSGFKQRIENEWILKFDADFKLEQIVTKDDPLFYKDHPYGANIMSGISYWKASDAEIILALLEQKIAQCKDEAQLPFIRTYYWDQLVRESVDQLVVKVELIAAEDWYEIDSQDDLNQVLITNAD